MKRQSKAEKQALNLINGKEKKKKNHPETLDLRWKGTVYGHVKDYKDQDYQAGEKKKNISTQIPPCSGIIPQDKWRH